MKNLIFKGVSIFLLYLCIGAAVSEKLGPLGGVGGSSYLPDMKKGLSENVRNAAETFQRRWSGNLNSFDRRWRKLGIPAIDIAWWPFLLILNIMAWMVYLLITVITSWYHILIFLLLAVLLVLSMRQKRQRKRQVFA